MTVVRRHRLAKIDDRTVYLQGLSCTGSIQQFGIGSYNDLERRVLVAWLVRE